MTHNSDIRYEIRNYTIWTLYKMYNSGDLLLENDFSRDFLWKNKEQVELIETILRNIPLPLIYLYQDEIGKYQIIDGKQRLQTIFNFIDNKFELNKSYYFQDYNKKKFIEIDSRYQYLFENYTLICYILRPPIPYELITDIFILLNTKGRKANEHELRRSIYRGKAIDLLKECKNLPIFVEITRNKNRFQRGKDEEIILKYFALYIWLHIKKFEFDSSNELLNKTIRYIYENQHLYNELYNAFNNSLERTVNILGKDCFNIQGKGVIPHDYSYFNTVLFETFCNITNIIQFDENKAKSIYADLKNNNRFVKSVHNNSIKNLIYRYKLIEQFKKY